MIKFNCFNQWSQIKSLSMIAVPISIAMMSQNLMTVVDSLMISHLGEAALAAIGLGGFIIVIINAVSIGLSTYVQRQTAYHLGSENFHKKYIALFVGVVVAATLLPIYAWGIFSTFPAWLFNIHDDTQVINELVPYVEVRVWAVTFIGLNFVFRGFCAATHVLKIYLIVTLIMHSLNLALNYIFIFGHLGLPAMGVKGAALASLIATIIASILYFFLILKDKLNEIHIRLDDLKYEFVFLKRILLPYGVQQMLFVAGFAVMLWIIGLISVQSLAVASVILNISLFFFLPAIGYGIAVAKMIAIELGKKDIRLVFHWGNLTMLFVFVVFSLISVPMLVFTKEFMSLFFSVPETLQHATQVMKIASMLFAVEALSLVLLQMLYAVDKGFSTMLSNIVIQWGMFLPILYVLVVLNAVSLVGVWLLLGFFRISNAIVFYLIWRNAQKTLVQKQFLN